MSGRRLTAILAADIAGYSALMSSNEVDTVTSLKGHQSVILPMVAGFGGRVVDVAGDGILAEFPSVLNAVKCAASIQEVMLERNTTVAPDRRMRFRIGINQGDVLFDEQRIFGDGVNVAARLEGVCDPGGICISGKVYDEIKDRFDVQYDDIGEQTLKNIPAPVRAYKINIGGTPLGKQIKPPSKLTIKLLSLLTFKLGLPSFKLPSVRLPQARWIAAAIVPILLIAIGAAWWTLSSDEATEDQKPSQAAENAPAPKPESSVAQRLQTEGVITPRPPTEAAVPQRPPAESTPAPAPSAAPEPPAIEARPERESTPKTFELASPNLALNTLRPPLDPPPPPVAAPPPREPDKPSLGDVTDIGALSRRGQLHAMKGEYSLAKLHFDEILLGRPQNVEALNDRCWVGAMLGDLTSALRDCDRAIELRPNFVDALDSRGLVKLKLGKPRDAIADYDAALSIQSQKASSLYGRGIAKRRTGNASGGDADIARAKSLKPGIADEFAGYGIR